MISQLLGAMARAATVFFIVAIPSTLIAGASENNAQAAILLAFAIAVVVGFEYGARYPAIIGFRDAPPFNRLRAIAALATLFCLSVVAKADFDTTFTWVLNALGVLIGRALDFPLSPVWVFFNTIPSDTPEIIVVQARIMAGLAIFIAFATLCVFAILIRLHQWPNHGRAFNVWINLPTFDPTTGADVVKRLIHAARVNVILGLVLLFLLPVGHTIVATHLGWAVFASLETMVWGIWVWMFLPLSFLMRGLAMARIADLIRARRTRLAIQAHPATQSSVVQPH